MCLFSSLKQKTSWKWSLVLSVLVGVYVGFQVRESLTQTIFSGKSFAARSLFVQFGLTLIYILIFSGVFTLIFASLWEYLGKFRKYLESNIYHRVYAVLILVGLGFCLIFFYNNIFPLSDTDDWLFSSFRSFYLMDIVGLDFRTGIYRPPHMVLNHENIYSPMSSNYPPFTILFFMPLQIFNENNAYLIAVFLYLIATILSLYLIAILVSEVLFSRLSLEKPIAYAMGISVLFVMLWYALSSYPFLFTIERGNYDSIAFLFAVLFVYYSIKKPKSIWLQVILLSIATHLKIYPAVLFVILLINHGRKIILPTLLVNIILLLSLGYNNALLFMDVIIRYSLAPVTWVGNHSGFSYADFLYHTYPGLISRFADLRIVLTLIPVIIWGGSFFLITRGMKSDVRTLFLFMVSVPLMCTIPTVSHDYKLIILNSSIMIMFSMLVYKIVQSSKAWDYLQIVLLLGLSFLLGRTFLLYPESLTIIKNKYPLIILLTIMMMINIGPLIKSTSQKPEVKKGMLKQDLSV